MTLTAKDIQSQQFHVRFRGFDVEEVDDFLEKIAATMETVNQENATLKDRLAESEKELAAYQSQEKSFQAAIIAAQKIAEEMKEKSRQEAEETLSQAREEAAKLQQEAHEEISGLEREVERIKELRAKVQEDMRQLLQSYMDQLENPQPESISQEQPVTMSAAPSFAEEDLSDDLYVKIDLPDDTLPETMEDMEPQEVSLPPMPETELLDMEEGEQQSLPNIPDLEGDMVFSLEDPLDTEEGDEHEPAVILGDDEEFGEEKKDE